VPPAAVPQAQPAEGAAPDHGLLPVTAPMVGKFYAAPSPSDPPFVLPGTKVAAGATVGLIEVMKVFASIKTETAGVIERILVSNGQFVEFGQTLFWIRPES
jgi:acetyl-CoA carboxylase biotin carboxyl carrier protein